MSGSPLARAASKTAVSRFVRPAVSGYEQAWGDRRAGNGAGRSVIVNEILVRCLAHQAERDLGRASLPGRSGFIAAIGEGEAGRDGVAGRQQGAEEQQKADRAVLDSDIRRSGEASVPRNRSPEIGAPDPPACLTVGRGRVSPPPAANRARSCPVRANQPSADSCAGDVWKGELSVANCQKRVRAARGSTAMSVMGRATRRARASGGFLGPGPCALEAWVHCLEQGIECSEDVGGNLRDGPQSVAIVGDRDPPPPRVAGAERQVELAHGHLVVRVGLL